MTKPNGYPCPVCDWAGQTSSARINHIKRHHPEELQPVKRAGPEWANPVSGAQTAAIYLRVSTIDQHPENQLPAIRAFCGARGFSVDPAHVYVDKASGKDMNRPNLQRLIGAAQDDTRPFDVVVFRRMSRLGRSLRDNVYLFDQFQKLNIALISVEEPYDTTTPAGRMLRNVLASVAEYERENLLEQQAEGIARRRLAGLPLGRHPAGCGYDYPCPWGVDHRGRRRMRLSQIEKDEAWERMSRAQTAAEKVPQNRGDLSVEEDPFSDGGL